MTDKFKNGERALAGGKIKVGKNFVSGVDIDLKDTKEIEEAISEKDDMEPAEVLEAVTKYKEELFAVAEASEAKTTTVNTSYTNTTNSYVYKPPATWQVSSLGSCRRSQV